MNLTPRVLRHAMAMGQVVDLIVKYQRLAENESARYVRASDVVKDLDKVLSLMIGSLGNPERKGAPAALTDDDR